MYNNRFIKSFVHYKMHLTKTKWQSEKITSGNVKPSITEVNPNRFPTLVLVSIAISIHLFSNWTLSSLSGVVSIVIATNNFMHSVLDKEDQKRLLDDK